MMKNLPQASSCFGFQFGGFSHKKTEKEKQRYQARQFKMIFFDLWDSVQFLQKKLPTVSPRSTQYIARMFFDIRILPLTFFCWVADVWEGQKEGQRPRCQQKRGENPDRCRLVVGFGSRSKREAGPEKGPKAEEFRTEAQNAGKEARQVPEGTPTQKRERREHPTVWRAHHARRTTLRPRTWAHPSPSS